MLVHVGRGGGERRHDLVVERAHHLVQLPPGAADVVDLRLELLVALLQRRELLERQRVHRAERRQLALQLLGVLRQRRALGRLGLGQARQLLGRRTEVARDVLVQRLHAQVHLVGLQVERARAGAHRLEALLGRVAVLAQALELLAARPHGVDLVLVVVAQRLEDAVEPVVLLLDHHFQAGQRRALGLQAAPARRRRRPLLGVALQAPLHLGLALGQHAAAFDHTGHPYLDLLAPAPEPDPPLLEGLPGLQRLLQLGQRPGQVRLLGGDVGQPLLRRHHGGAGLLELGGDAALLLGGALPVGPARLAGGGVAVVGPLGRGRARRGSGRAQCGSRRGGRGPARPRRRRPRPGGAPLRPRRP